MTTADDTMSTPATVAAAAAAARMDLSRPAGSGDTPASDAGAPSLMPPVPSLENARRSQEEVEDAFAQATAAMRAGQLEEAAAQFRKILFTHPDHGRARANLGNCQFLLGDLVNAESSFRAVLTEVPENHNALYGLASILIQQGNLEDAQGFAGRLCSLMPDSAPAQTLLGDAASSDPRPGTAIAAYRAALRIDPAYAPALIGLSRLLLKRNRLDEARDLAERALAEDAQSVAAFVCLGDALAALGELSPAREAYDAALGLSPSDTDIKVRLSLLARKSGDLKAALRHADDAWTERADDREAGNAIGAALAALGERMAAREVLTAMANGRPVPDWVRDVIEKHRTVPMPDLVWSPHAPLQSPSVQPAAIPTAVDTAFAASSEDSDYATAEGPQTPNDSADQQRVSGAEPDGQAG